MNIYQKTKQKKFVAHIFMFIFLLSPIMPAVAGDSLYFTNIKTEQENNITFKIVWSTNTASGGRVIYGKDKDNLNAYIVDSRVTKHHEVSIGNLEGDETYYYKITAFNNNGIADSSIKSFETDEYSDGKAPIISNLKIPYITETVAVFEWNTNEKSTSWVEYGDVNNKYAHSAGSNSKTKDHLVIIKNLSGNVKYFTKVYSVDEDGNKSSVNFKDFSTRENRDRNEDLVISNLRPSGQNDPGILSDSIKISFKTNHFAKGNILLTGSNGTSQSVEVKYGLNHDIFLSGLSPKTKYDIKLTMNDVFGKNDESEVLGVTTPEREKIDVCEIDSSKYSGYFGKYFNIPISHPTIKQNIKERDEDWYSDEYLSFSQIDSSLNFGNGFFPLNEGMEGDPYYFAVYWRAKIEMPSEGKFEYKIASDDGSWVYIDGKLITSLGGIHPARSASYSTTLSKGSHVIEIYFVEQAPRHSHFSFVPNRDYEIHPDIECPSVSVGDNLEDVVVKGVEFSMYTSATAIYKTSTSPSIYAIVNNQSHYISSPSSFEEYGYKWEDIKTVSDDELAKHPRARLIRSAENSAIYFLYQRPENQWLKIAMPSPTVFVSYPSNHWGNVIVVTQDDVDSYPDVKLIKTKKDPAVYSLENNERRHVSASVFEKHGFSYSEIAEVNETHMNSYKTGQDLK